MNISNRSVSKRSILIVDDEADIRESISEIVEHEFQFTLAANGQDAFDCVSKQAFDVILTDFDMPILNGFEFIRRLHEKAVETPIVVLTGRGSQELLKKTTAFNVFDYLEKPFSPDNLLKVLRSSCNSNWKTTRGPNLSNPLSKVLYEDFDIRVSKEAAETLKSLAAESGGSISHAIENLLKAQR